MLADPKEQSHHRSALENLLATRVNQLIVRKYHWDGMTTEERGYLEKAEQDVREAGSGIRITRGKKSGDLWELIDSDSISDLVGIQLTPSAFKMADLLKHAQGDDLLYAYAHVYHSASAHLHSSGISMHEYYRSTPEGKARSRRPREMERDPDNLRWALNGALILWELHRRHSPVEIPLHLHEARIRAHELAESLPIEITYQKEETASQD